MDDARGQTITEPAAVPADSGGAQGLGFLERQLIDAYQRGFPLVPRPYGLIARRLGVAEGDVIAALRRLEDRGVLSRVGAVVRPHEAGWSTLAAMAVPGDRLPEVAYLVNAYPEVNHNYEREHRFNLWFVVTAADGDSVRRVLDEIKARTGIGVMDLPLVAAYHIDLGFPIQWR